MSARSSALQPAAAKATAGWMRGPREPQLPHAAVHVWRADLATVDDNVLRSLSGEEADRARRISGERERLLWSRARGALRELLACYLRNDASAIELTAGRHGKPELAGDDGQRLFFNLAHSRQLALYAFTAAAPVGVDVQVAREHGVRADTDYVALTGRVFGEAEARRLGGLRPAACEREFLRMWTRHEAELKRRGSGIGIGAVDTAGASAHDQPGDAPWIVELDVGAEAAAAIAVAPAMGDLQLWEWR